MVSARSVICGARKLTCKSAEAGVQLHDGRDAMHAGDARCASPGGAVHAGPRTVLLCRRTNARRRRTVRLWQRTSTRRAAYSALVPEENCTSGEEQRARREEHCTPAGAKCMPRPLMVPAAPRIVRGAERVTNHRLREGSREDAKGETRGSRTERVGSEPSPRGR